tara:strand:- start:386 stop:532 length:147 start_codon:yes stop_codon:yes gene_type:complete
VGYIQLFKGLMTYGEAAQTIFQKQELEKGQIPSSRHELEAAANMFSQK